MFSLPYPTFLFRSGFRSLLIAFGLAMAWGPISSQGELMPGKKPDPPAAQRCKEDLAKRIAKQPDNIWVADAWPAIWQDAALGMPDGEGATTSARLPGHVIILQAENRRYVYTASGEAIKYGGIEELWSHSLLYILPTPGDPNQNSTLFQCSLLGTNRSRVVSGVAEFYPQKDGRVLFVRRTSRSSFDLLHVKVDGLVKGDGLQDVTRLFSAPSIGSAAIDDTGKRWAAFVKPGLGEGWKVAINGMFADDAEAKTLVIPDAGLPNHIGWSGAKVVILMEKDGSLRCFETDPAVVPIVWKPLDLRKFPGRPDYVLNKSQTLVVEEVEKDGIKGVEVALSWWNGNRDTCGFVPKIKPLGDDFVDGHFVVIRGEDPAGPAVCVVDIWTNETHPCIRGIGKHVKPLLFPPVSSPLKPSGVMFEK